MPKPRETLLVKESTRRSMMANRSSGTSIEISLRRALWAAGIRGYRKNVAKLPGTPDLVFGRQKVAVFVHGCYWHRCPKCRKDAAFKTNEAFWRSKLDENVQRDARNQARLLALGYENLVLWECELKKSIDECVDRVRECLLNRSQT